jgi:hypothetical protein
MGLIKESRKEFNFGDYVLWFPKGNKSHLRKFGPYKIQYVLPNNIVLLVTIEKFKTNLVLVNMNELKPFKYMEEYEVKKRKNNNNNICQYIGNKV